MSVKGLGGWQVGRLGLSGSVFTYKLIIIVLQEADNRLTIKAYSNYNWKVTDYVHLSPNKRLKSLQ